MTTDFMTIEQEDSIRARLVKPAEFPCCGRGASLGDDRLTEIADQLAQGVDEVVLDRKCSGVDCKDPETGRRGIRYRLHVRYSPANGLCGDASSPTACTLPLAWHSTSRSMIRNAASKPSTTPPPNSY